MSLRIVAIMIVALTLVASPLVSAEDQTTLMLADDQITAIKTNCVEAQSTLTRVFSNDVLTRVHLGGEYDTISGKFMAPMNSRIALNKLDGVALAKTTLDFNNKLTDFREAYQQYKETMTKLTQMKCVDQPVAFYDSLTIARTDRAKVHDCVLSLNSLAKQYQTQVRELKAKTATQSQGDTAS